MTFTFAPATREQAKARIGLQGPAGSGKTKTALRMAEGLANGGTIGVVDTERGSALKYAPVPGRPELGGHEFGHMPMDTHDPRNLIEAVQVAEAAGIAVLVIDSWSHFYNGRGGLLEIVDQAGSKQGSGGTFGGWRVGTPIEQQMLDAILNFKGHLIVTMRTKGDYVIDGKKVTKVGVKAVQREGAEYELDVVMDMVEGTATVTKTRYSGLENLQVHHPGEDIAAVILEQLGQGVDPVEAILERLRAEDLTYQGALDLFGQARQRGLLEVVRPHPTTGADIALGELIKEYGSALKPQPAPAPGEAAGPTTPASPPPSSTESSGTPEAPVTAPAAAEVAEPATGEGVASAAQMRKIFALFNDLTFKPDREKRLMAVSLLVGRPVPTMNDLTWGEASSLIETLADFAQHADEGPQLLKDCLNKLHAEAQPAADAA